MPLDIAKSDPAQLVSRFFHFLDEARYDDLIAMFDADGAWHRQGEILVGHAAIRAAMEARSPTAHSRHVISSIFAVDDPSDLRLMALMTAYKFDDGKHHDAPVVIDRPFRVSAIDTRLRRVEAGWLITRMIMTTKFEFGTPAMATAQ